MEGEFPENQERRLGSEGAEQSHIRKQTCFHVVCLLRA